MANAIWLKTQELSWSLSKENSCVASVHAYSNLHQEGTAVERSDLRPHTDYFGQVVEISKSCPSIGSAKTALVRPRQISPGS